MGCRFHKDHNTQGSGGGGSVGRAAASDNRDLRFESQHWQGFIYQSQFNRKDKNKEKEAGNGPFKKDHNTN